MHKQKQMFSFCFIATYSAKCSTRIQLLGFGATLWAIGVTTTGQ